jgi:hypothetical protein
MLRRLGVIAGAVSLVLLSVILSVSFKQATANGATYLEALGITGVPPFLKTALAGTLFTILLTVIVTAVVTSRVIRWRSNARSVSDEEPEGPGDYDLYCSMDSLTDRMRAYLKYEGFGIGSDDPNDILADCQSLNLTLHKQGFAIPYIAPGTAQRMFNVLDSYYTVIGPLLRDGHREHAMELAKSFAEKHPPPA